MQNPAVMNQFGQMGMWSMGHPAPLAAPMNQMAMGAGRMGQHNVVQLQNQYLPPGQFPGYTSGLVSAPDGGMSHNQMEEFRWMQLNGMMPVQPGMTSSGVPQGHSSMGHLPMAPGQPPMVLNHPVHMGMQSMGHRSTHAHSHGAPMNQMAMGAGRMGQQHNVVQLQNQYLPPGQFPAGSSSGHGGMPHNKVEEVRRMQLQKQGMMTPGQPPRAGRMGQANIVQLQNQYLPQGQFPAGSSSGMSHNKMEEVRRMQIQKQGMMPVQPGMSPSGLPQGHSGMGHLPMASRQTPSVPNADPYVSRTTRANKMINGMQNPAGAYGR